MSFSSWEVFVHHFQEINGILYRNALAKSVSFWCMWNHNLVGVFSVIQLLHVTFSSFYVTGLQKEMHVSIPLRMDVLAGVRS